MFWRIERKCCAVGNGVDKEDGESWRKDFLKKFFVIRAKKIMVLGETLKKKKKINLKRRWPPDYVLSCRRYY